MQALLIFKMLTMTEERIKKVGSDGGLARAKALSEKDKKLIAKKGALARWGVKAIKKGNFKEEFGIDVECYVLDDLYKTAVISQTGMANVLGFSRGSDFPRFLSSKGMQETLNAEIYKKTSEPLKFQWTSANAQAPSVTVYGFDVALLIDICKAIVLAEEGGKLAKSQANTAKQAALILIASAKLGIKHLVYALSGYDIEKEEVIAAFKAYVQEEAKKYEPEFPSELYLAWNRLYQPKLPQRGKPWEHMHLTIKHIYFPLAKSNGKLLELLRAVKAQGGERNKKLFQFLNDIGARALRMQLGRILEMAESSPDKKSYEKKIVERFGGQQELDF